MRGVAHWSASHHRDRARGHIVRLLLTLCLVGTVAASASTVRAGTDEPPRFADGSWKGTMVWVGSVALPSAAASGGSDGQFDATFAGGLPSGSFSFTGTGQGSSSSVTATLSITVHGSIEGTAEAPLLVGSSGSMSGTAYSSGIEVPIDVPLAGSLGSAPLTIVHADCDMVTGNFSAQIDTLAEQVGSMGGSLDISEAKWFAKRSGTDGATDADQLQVANQLVTDGMAIVASIELGTFDAAALQDLLHRSANFAASIEHNADCGIGDEGHFSSVVAGVVTDVLNAMLDRADSFTAAQFQSATVAGLAAGVLGSGSGESGAQLRTKLLDAFLVKLTQAIADGDQDAMFAVAVAAGALHDTELAAQALAEAEKV